MATILTKKSDTSSSVPLAADLTNAAGGAELAVNTADKRLYSKTSGGSVVELGTNPSSMTLPNGTANGVPYLNGSKVLTSGSALTFDGTNFGVGVASPLRPLDVLQRTNDTTPAVLLRGYTTGADGARTVLMSTVSSDANNWANLAISAQSHIWQYQGSEQMRLTSTGLGIGTSSPAFKFDAQRASSGTVGRFYSTGGTDANISIRNNTQEAIIGADNTQSYLLNSGAYPWTFWTNNTERVRIDSSGNLLVGTTSSLGGLGAKVNIDSGANRGIVQSTNSNVRMQEYLVSGTTVGFISNNGTVTTYSTSSDYRLKENIAPMTGALAKLAALKPVTYKWKADGSDGEGFIAHELAEVCPSAVTGEKDAVDKDGKPQYQGIDVSFLVGTLTAAIQELKAEFDAYKATHP